MHAHYLTAFTSASIYLNKFLTHSLGSAIYPYTSVDCMSR